MALCRHYRKQNIFLTITANPKWLEILEQLLLEAPPPAGANYQQRRQTAADRDRKSVV